jgi:hypothetical protein
VAYLTREASRRYKLWLCWLMLVALFGWARWHDHQLCQESHHVNGVGR